MQPTHWQTAYRLIREDRANSYAVRSSLQTAMDRDPLDAYFDALLVVRVLRARANEILGKGDGIVDFESDDMGCIPSDCGSDEPPEFSCDSGTRQPSY